MNELNFHVYAVRPDVRGPSTWPDYRRGQEAGQVWNDPIWWANGLLLLHRPGQDSQSLLHQVWHRRGNNLYYYYLLLRRLSYLLTWTFWYWPAMKLTISIVTLCMFPGHMHYFTRMILTIHAQGHNIIELYPLRRNEGYIVILSVHSSVARPTVHKVTISLYTCKELRAYIV